MLCDYSIERFALQPFFAPKTKKICKIKKILCAGKIKKIRTSACAATQRRVNPLLAGGCAAAWHQTFRKTDLA